jgi:hypothetical protein
MPGLADEPTYWEAELWRTPRLQRSMVRSISARPPDSFDQAAEKEAVALFGVVPFEHVGRQGGGIADRSSRVFPALRPSTAPKRGTVPQH